jgi:hypothetical protein
MYYAPFTPAWITFSTLKVEAAGSTKTLVFLHQISRLHIPEDPSLSILVFGALVTNEVEVEDCAF